MALALHTAGRETGNDLAPEDQHQNDERRVAPAAGGLVRGRESTSASHPFATGRTGRRRMIIATNARLDKGDIPACAQKGPLLAIVDSAGKPNRQDRRTRRRLRCCSGGWHREDPAANGRLNFVIHNPGRVSFDPAEVIIWLISGQQAAA
jgi:hypothetical protein